MSKFQYSLNSIQPSLSTGLFTVETTATGAGSVVALTQILLAGQNGVVNSFNRLVVNRPSADPTGAATARAPQLANPASATPTFVMARSYATTQGTLSTNDVLSLAFDGKGGKARWEAYPNQGIITGGQGAVSYLLVCRSRSGTAEVNGHVVCEEL